MVRIKIILGYSRNKIFEPFDRFAQLKEDQNKPINELMEEFVTLRKSNLKELNSLNIKDEDLSRTGIHLEFGSVTLRQLIST